jgi:hypothetical protein
MLLLLVVVWVLLGRHWGLLLLLWLGRVRMLLLLQLVVCEG